MCVLFGPLSPKEREHRLDQPGNQHVMPMVTVIEVFCTGMNQLERYQTAYRTVIKKDKRY
jgi:hypothetical protein